MQLFARLGIKPESYKISEEQLSESELAELECEKATLSGVSSQAQGQFYEAAN